MGRKAVPTDASGFVLLSDFVPHIVQEIRYYSTYNFIGERIDGYEEPVALLTREAARALKAVSNEMIVQGYRLKVFDAYRPMAAVKRRAETLNFDKVIYVGENFGGVSRDEAKAELFAYVRSGDSVLLKASHGMALNRLLEDCTSEQS